MSLTDANQQYMGINSSARQQKILSEVLEKQILFFVCMFVMHMVSLRVSLSRGESELKLLLFVMEHQNNAKGDLNKPKKID